MCNASPLGEIMTHTEIQEVHRKLALSVKRDDSGKVMPTQFSEREKNFMVFHMMHKMREDNRKRFAGRMIQKNWNKMSKKEKNNLEL